MTSLNYVFTQLFKPSGQSCLFLEEVELDKEHRHQEGAQHGHENPD